MHRRAGMHHFHTAHLPTHGNSGYNHSEHTGSLSSTQHNQPIPLSRPPTPLVLIGLQVCFRRSSLGDISDVYVSRASDHIATGQVALFMSVSASHIKSTTQAEKSTPIPRRDGGRFRFVGARFLV